VKTEFGWHVIKLESAAPESVRPFEDVRAELENELRHSQVEKAFGDAQEELDTAAFEASGDIEAVASKVDLPVKQVDRYTRAGSAEFGGSKKVTEAVFAPDVIAGREVRTVELEPGKVIALVVKNYEPSRAKPLEAVRGEVTESARLVAAGKLAAARATESVTELGKGAPWETSVASLKSDPAKLVPKSVGRQDPDVPAEVRDAAFRALAPKGDPRYGTAALANGDAAIWTVTAVQPGKLATMAADGRQRAHDEARDREAMSDATVYITSLRSNADVDVNSKLFE